MYSLGDPPKLKEHLFTPSKSKCLELKEIAEESSLIYFTCEKINAVIKDGKIIRVIEKIEVFEWNMKTVTYLQKYWERWK